jgi:hypothetical protein
MSANLVPTDATLCHYGAGKGYIPGIAVVGSQFTSSTPPPAIDNGAVITLTNDAPLVDTTDSSVANSSKRYRPLILNATSTGFPGASVYDVTTFIITQNVACNNTNSSANGQSGTNRSYNMISSYNDGGAQPVDLILDCNYIKLGSSSTTYIGTGSTQEHVLIVANTTRNTQNALGIRGPLIIAPTTSVQGDPYLRIVPSIPVSGSTPLGTIREIQLNDPLQAGPFALPLSYLSPAGNAVLIRTNGLTNNRTLPISECGVTITTAAVTNATSFSLSSSPSYNTGIGANTYTIGSASITLPSDSLGKTYIIEACVATTPGNTITVGGVEIRGGVISVVGSVVLGTNTFGDAVGVKVANVMIKTFYTSVVNREVIGLYNNTGETLTPVATGKFMIREVPRTDA